MACLCCKCDLIFTIDASTVFNTIRITILLRYLIPLIGLPYIIQVHQIYFSMKFNHSFKKTMTKRFVLAWKFANYISSIIFKRLTSFRSGHLSGNIWLWISILKDITQSTLKRVVNHELSSTEHNSFHNSFSRPRLQYSRSYSLKEGNWE